MIRASNWRPLERNTLQGYLTLHLTPSELTIHECTYRRSASGPAWVGLPARPQHGNANLQEHFSQAIFDWAEAAVGTPAAAPAVARRPTQYFRGSAQKVLKRSARL